MKLKLNPEGLWVATSPPKDLITFPNVPVDVWKPLQWTNTKFVEFKGLLIPRPIYYEHRLEELEGHPLRITRESQQPTFKTFEIVYRHFMQGFRPHSLQKLKREVYHEKIQSNLLSKT